MCEQCSAATTDLGEPIPGIMLVQATKDGGCMKAGQYGLVEENDPFLIFDMKPTPDPCEGLIDEEVNGFEQAEIQVMMDWLDIARNFDNLFRVSLDTGWRFVDACRRAGYKATDGSVAIWFFHRAGEMLNKRLFVNTNFSGQEMRIIGHHTGVTEQPDGVEVSEEDDS